MPVGSVKMSPMEEKGTYELGFLLTPLLTEEGVAGFLSGVLADLFKRHDATIKTTEGPKMISLAYTVRKRIENKNQTFNEAYFGAIRFEAAAEEIPGLVAGLKKINEIIRSLVIAIPKVTEAPAPRRPQANNENTVTPPQTIDKEIDDLLNSKI